MWLIPAAITCSVAESASVCVACEKAATPKIASVLMCPVLPSLRLSTFGPLALRTSLLAAPWMRYTER
jgi:hypothetical protein